MLKILTKSATLASIGDTGLIITQTRHIRIRKPPWEPRAKSKQFRVPPLHVPDPAEHDYMVPIWQHYRASMRSVYSLFKTEAKFSDKASLKAQEERRIEAERETNVLAENERENRRLLGVQLEEEEASLNEKKKRAEEVLRAKMARERELVRVADEKVRRLKEASKGFVEASELEREIEKALNERKSYNFAIDTKGNVYRAENNN